MANEPLKRDLETTRKVQLIRRVVRTRLRRQATDLIDDFTHVERVWNNARFLAAGEFRRSQTSVDGDILEATILLHVDVPQIYSERDTPKKRIITHAEEMLHEHELSHLVWPVCDALSSFMQEPDEGRPYSNEAALAHDADLLDDLGAVGIMRAALTTAGAAVPELYDVDDPAAVHRSLDASSFAIDAVPLRVERGRGCMLTASGKAEAQRRSLLMEGFYREFLLNCDMLPG
jgi:uncharacterized protein